MKEFPIYKKNYSQWKTHVYVICHYEMPKLGLHKPSVKEIQALIERGAELKKEGKIRNCDEWAHSMWMLKNKLKERQHRNTFQSLFGSKKTARPLSTRLCLSISAPIRLQIEGLGQLCAHTNKH